MSNYKLNQIFLGEVMAVQNYGAFIKIPGCKQQGLIHKSQVSMSRIDDVSEVLQRGERVWCKIIFIGDDGKIGLSMKVVNQGNGSDLDPNGVELQQDEKKRKRFGTTQRKAIELEAIFNTTCSKCGTKGHLANDCFSTPDGKKYDLLPEIKDDSVTSPTPPTLLQSSEFELKSDSKEKNVQSKQSEKLKKSTNSKHRSNNSSDDNSCVDERKKKKKRKKHSKKLKRKKRKYSESSSGESSDSFTREKHSKKLKQKKRKHSESSSGESSDSFTREKHSKKCKHSKSKHSD